MVLEEEPEDPRLLLPLLPRLALLPRLPLLPLEIVPFDVVVLDPELPEIFPVDEVEAPRLRLELEPMFLR